MNYWLIKSEPSKYSWEQFEKDGIAIWDGVRNYAARNNLRSMKKGDLAFWYHSNEGMEIVGIAKVVKESYQDPTADNPAWLVVDFKPFQKIKKPMGNLYSPPTNPIYLTKRFLDKMKYGLQRKILRGLLNCIR